MIKDYWSYSCCTVRIYRGCSLCPRAYTQPPRPHWGSSSDPAPVCLFQQESKTPLYNPPRPWTVEWYLVGVFIRKIFRIFYNVVYHSCSGRSYLKILGSTAYCHVQVDLFHWSDCLQLEFSADSCTQFLPLGPWYILIIGKFHGQGHSKPF